MPDPVPPRPIDRLLAIMARLRDPVRGCPWDVEQDFSTIAPYTIEEAYEVADAVARQDMKDLREELGDLLLQVVFHARMAEEAGHFGFEDVATAISQKMVSRHPHVFGSAAERDATSQSRAWEEHKAQERAAKGQANSVLDGVPMALPALLRAEKLGKRAARAGFDWPDAAAVLDKVREETGEIDEAMRDKAPAGRVGEEIGDLLFAAAQLARHHKLNPETVLRDANRRFELRFRHVEAALAAQGRKPDEAGMDELEALWGAAKRALAKA